MDETMNTGVVEQEVAEPATEETTEVTETTTETTEQAQEEQAPKVSMDKIWGTLRHKAEADAQRKYQQQQAQYDARIAAICNGAINPATGQPITTMNDYLQALEVKLQADTRSRIQNGRATYEDINSIAARAARAEVEAQRQAMQRQADAERRVVEGERQLNEQISELGKLDPAIKEFEDLTKMKNFNEFNDLVMRGYTLVDAYKTLNYDNAKANSAKSAAQATINAAKGKDHLAPVGGRGAEDSGLSPELLEAYKQMGFSSKEAASWHKRLNK